MRSSFRASAVVSALDVLSTVREFSGLRPVVKYCNRLFTAGLTRRLRGFPPTMTAWRGQSPPVLVSHS